MKYFVVAVCLVAQLASSFVVGIGSESSRSDVTWSTPCTAGDGGGGSGTLLGLKFSGCNSDKNCTLNVEQNYDLDVNVMLGRNESSLKLDLKILAVSPPGNPSQVIANETFAGLFPPSVQIGFVLRANLSSANFAGKFGTYNVQVKLFNPEDNLNALCRTFPVVLGEGGPQNDHSLVDLVWPTDGKTCSSSYRCTCECLDSK